MSSGGCSNSEEELSLLAVASTCNCDRDRDCDRARDSRLMPSWTSPMKESRLIGGVVADGVEIASTVPMRNNSIEKPVSVIPKTLDNEQAVTDCKTHHLHELPLSPIYPAQMKSNETRYLVVSGP